MSIEAKFKISKFPFELDVELSIPSTGVTAIFGDSGAGKSTMLRCMSGLERATNGFFKIGESIWQDETTNIFRPTHRRSLGFVFQEPTLFPHLNVQKNLLYGFNRTPEAERNVQLDEAIEWLGIAPLLQRRTTALSGGEKQRVSIARALVTSPKLLLMDEPLASLDIRARNEILPYLEKLHQRLSIPIIYVSHAIEEVARLADWLVLLNEGKVTASGAIAEVLTRSDLPLANADHAISVFDATVQSIDESFGLTTLNVAGNPFVLPRVDLAVGAKLRVTIQARDVSITKTAPQNTSILNILPCRVSCITDPGGSQVVVKLEANGIPLLSRITKKSTEHLGLQVGSYVFAQIKSVATLK
ncbi:MAG: molybdenum ABC transporter ATP-binding protein [Verrucomicrobia bacterium]|nr:molybdenum ABC transporter ATP-binding protein [Verrucomicrobiota bacterium]MDA1069223.1 molybdenum ABC transporter ATP-binding protein [Verrucomicrobiota bacterium]